ncbi:RNA binding protein [Pochonia chlamydosporia 170]|uniref:RNA binding protein n=1 Tax=Pochonia chlamydosporia 170 TaxID=1380566 RepID=A0A179FY18_METCM|nr:RNA binding protein [Pochonia chlamydosporia 170]OAQ70522.1 RNA binding protein [Pochonia chlamydosporia 170]
MAGNMDRGLDEIIAEKRSSGPRTRRGGRDNRRRDRNDYPRDGSTRDDRRNLDRSVFTTFAPDGIHETNSFYSEWVHDRYDESESRRGPAPRRRRESPVNETKGSKVRVENIHYDLTEEDLDELFARIGRVTKLNLRYDRAGRSEGVAYVTYDRKEDAEEAIKQFDGANANGQPIRLTLLPSRNPFDTAVMPGRPLAERISAPGAGGRARSTSPRRRVEEEDVARKGIDRYIPGGRSRSPAPRRGGTRGGRRPGARREGRDNNNNEGGRGGRGNPRGKKTQEELDAEMADYFGGGGNDSAAATGAPANGAASAPAVANDDIDMIE